jgi:PilZ domain
MSTSCTVIVGATELHEALRLCAPENSEILTFSDDEPLKALEAITARQPSVIALGRLFAATSRGAALINRIKADRALAATEIRVVSLDGTYRVSRRRTPVPPQPPEQTPSASPTPAVVEPEITMEVLTPPPAADATARNLDYRGTRRAQRFRMVEGIEAQVDGAIATIVDLSRIGAQILCPAPLKPQQRVRMILGDDLGLVKFSASVAWASFEIPKGKSRYRAGIEFNDAEASSIDAFCRRHKS